MPDSCWIRGKARDLSAIETTVLVLTPLLAFGGSIIGHLVTRRTASELDRWRKREETMRLLRWSTELAIDGDEDRSRAGLVVLGGLLDSPLLDEADIQLVATVTAHVAGDPGETDLDGLVGQG